MKQGKTAPIFQGTQLEEAVAKDDKTSGKNDQKKIITVKGNGKWR